MGIMYTWVFGEVPNNKTNNALGGTDQTKTQIQTPTPTETLNKQGGFRSVN
jgi:hypothetical protein